MTDLLITCSITDFFNAQTFFLWFVDNASYLFVFLFMVLESSFIPFPSEVVVPPAAYLATAQGSSSDLNIWLVVFFATLGALVGALINYVVSLWVGRPIIYAFADSRLGHACLIDRSKVDKAEKYFDKHGASSTFIGRLIPVIRQLISIPAGLARMNLLKFITYTTLGALLWNIILAVLGYWLGRTVTFSQLFDKIEQYNTYLSYAGLALLVVCVLYIAWNAMRNHKEK